MEAHTHTRGKLKPDPEFDPVLALFYFVHHDWPSCSDDSNRENSRLGIILIDIDNSGFTSFIGKPYNTTAATPTIGATPTKARATVTPTKGTTPTKAGDTATPTKGSEEERDGNATPPKVHKSKLYYMTSRDITIPETFIMWR